MPITTQGEVAAYCILRSRDGDIKKAADEIIALADRIKAEREANL